MPVLREQDFDKLAARVVDRFLSGEAKLADAAAEEATANGLNPDQIDRLAQAANTQTFLRMMDERKTAGAQDLMHEFDPIDSRQVIRLVIDNAGVHVMPSEPGMDMSDAGLHGEMPVGSPEMAPDMDEIPDEMGPAKTPPKKKNDDADEGKKKSKTASETDNAFRIRRLRKMAGVLQDQFYQTEYLFEEKMAALVERFKRAHSATSYDAFEKDAMVEYATPVGVGVLNAIREHRKLDPLPFDSVREKAASFADRHVSDDTPELHLFENLVKIAEEAQKLQRGLEWVRAQCA